MYFIDGNRIYIKPESGCGSLNEQLQNCLQQLGQINSEKKIFKLNFFVDTASGKVYTELTKSIQQEVKSRFSEEIILNFIAQPPLTCRIIIEAFYYDASKWQARFIKHENDSSILFRREDTEFLIGNVQSGYEKECSQNARLAFTRLSEILRDSGFSSQFDYPAVELCGRNT